LLLTIFEAVGEISNIGWRLKLRCDERFTHAFTACNCVFKEITLV